MVDTVTPQKMINFIKEFCSQNEYEIGFEKDNTDLEVFLNYAHGVSFYAQVNGAHVQVYQYQGRPDKSEEDYRKHSIYSLRNQNDVVDFCAILSYSSRIRAGRRES